MAVGAPGPNGPSAASLAAKVDTRRGQEPATNRLQTMEANCAREMHSRLKFAPDNHAVDRLNWQINLFK